MHQDLQKHRLRGSILETKQDGWRQSKLFSCNARTTWLSCSIVLGSHIVTDANRLSCQSSNLKRFHLGMHLHYNPPIHPSAWDQFGVVLTSTHWYGYTTISYLPSDQHALIPIGSKLFNHRYVMSSTHEWCCTRPVPCNTGRVLEMSSLELW